MGKERATLGVILGLLVGLATFPALAAAADLPRSVRLIVPANGSSMPLVIAHMLAKKTRQTYGLTLVVESNEQHSPETVVERFASAPPDGKTLLVLSRGMQMAFAAEGKGAVGELAPVAGLAAMPYLIVAPFEAPAKTLSELIVFAQKRKGEVSYGSAGADYLARIAGQMLNKSNGLSMRHVAFDKTFTALAAVMRGKVSVVVEAAPAALPYVHTRRVLGVATTSKGRLAAVPLVPALSETIPDLELVNWIGLFAPSGTSRSIIDALNRELNEVLGSVEVHVRLTHMGLIPVRTTPARFAAEVNSDPRAPISQVRAVSGTY